MNNKNNKVLGILLIIWGTLLFCYNMFFPKSVYSLLGNKALNYSLDQIEKYKEALQNIYSVLNIIFILSLAVLILLIFINLKKENKVIISNNSLILSVVALILHIIGFIGISWIFAIISGFLLIKNNKD